MKTLILSSLKKFDVILVRFPNSEESTNIRNACNSEYSHAIIYLGNGSFIEGVQPIVSLFSYHRYYFPDFNNVKVLRLSADFRTKLNEKDTEDFLRRLAYCNYSKRLLYFIQQKNISSEIITTFKNKRMWQGGVVCTSLITLPYYVGGIDISKNDEPYYAHFGDIERFEGFEDVTQLVFEDVNEFQLRHDAFDYLTTFETGSLLENQSKVAKKLNSYVENKFNDILRNPDNYKDIVIDRSNLIFSTWEDMFPNIMRWFLSKTGRDIDLELSNLIVETRYNMLWFDEVHRNKSQFFPVYYQGLLHKSKEDLIIMRDLLRTTKERMEVSEQTTFENFSLCPCKTFHILLDMYRSFADLLRSSENQYNALIKLGSKL